MDCQGSPASGFVTSRFPGRGCVVCPGNVVPRLFNVRLTIAGNTGKVAGQFGPLSQLSRLLSFSRNCWVTSMCVWHLVSSNLQPFQGRVFSFLQLPTGWVPGCISSQSSWLAQSCQAKTKKGQDVWVTLERYQAAVSARGFLSKAPAHLQRLRSCT